MERSFDEEALIESLQHSNVNAVKYMESRSKLRIFKLGNSEGEFDFLPACPDELSQYLSEFTSMYDKGIYIPQGASKHPNYKNFSIIIIRSNADRYSLQHEFIHYLLNEMSNPQAELIEKYGYFQERDKVKRTQADIAKLKENLVACDRGCDLIWQHLVNNFIFLAEVNIFSSLRRAEEIAVELINRKYSKQYRSEIISNFSDMAGAFYIFDNRDIALKVLDSTIKYINSLNSWSNLYWNGIENMRRLSAISKRASQIKVQLERIN